MRKLQLCTLAVAALLTGCLPVTSANISLGIVDGEQRMQEAEQVVQSVGFCRQPWVSEGEHLDRMKIKERLIAEFKHCSEPGFGAAVFFTLPSNELKVVFAERNTHFSNEGEAILQLLLSKLREEFNDSALLVR